jgi:hypothetical protein
MWRVWSIIMGLCWDRTGGAAAERRPTLACGFNRGSAVGVGRGPPGRLKRLAYER